LREHSDHPAAELRSVDASKRRYIIMLRATPFLLFDGNCDEAMTFYHDCLGGELTLTRLGVTPMQDPFPPAKHTKVINANLKSVVSRFQPIIAKVNLRNQ
jgi:hypothetical protein